ncbi:D-alanyl-D-alanine carboxypeptidase family protein [Salinispirillum marinum]|uniref:D-alanyl-D-alanine carboxypeptidase family protein n=2 Tax=Saccharospirillaceae TaxID=255527 RepID=A0ABV8BH39_9GAMM
MKRRTFLEGLFVSGAAAACGHYVWYHNRLGQPVKVAHQHITAQEIANSVHIENAHQELSVNIEEFARGTRQEVELLREIEAQAQASLPQDVIARATEQANQSFQAPHDDHDHGTSTVEHNEPDPEYLDRIRRFDDVFENDVWVDPADWELVISANARLERVREWVGFGNFNILTWDDMLRFARNVPTIGEFTPREVALMDGMFHRDASELGFMGERTTTNIAVQIRPNDVVSIPRSGHYLYRGESSELYARMVNDIGDTLILTSGVRNVAKQFDLFLAKLQQTEGNLSRASRSLAPPGYSFHALGDFDVGQVGLGLGNFSSEFANTREFRKLQEMGYSKIRYTVDNRFGVRFEPWHVRVG